MQKCSIILICGILLVGCETPREEHSVLVDVTIVNVYQDRNKNWLTVVELPNGARQIEDGNLGEVGDEMQLWVYKSRLPEKQSEY